MVGFADFAREHETALEVSVSEERDGDGNGGKLVARPERGEAGDGVEVLKVHEAADGFVVIASDEHASQSLRFGNDFVRIAAVADRVSEIDDEVVSRSGGQTGVQRFEVGVNVAKKKGRDKG